jgi:hypothetical protein
MKRATAAMNSRMAPGTWPLNQRKRIGVLEDDRLRLVLRTWTAFGIPLPLKLAPTGESYESVQNERFTFHVEIGHPLIGRIVEYRGWLVPKTKRGLDPHRANGEIEPKAAIGRGG